MPGTLLLTSYPPAWRELAAITTATMRRYCDAQGYEFYADCSETSMPHRSPLTTEQPTGYIPTRYFIKFALLEHFLNPESCKKYYDEVAWIDSDCVVSRYDLPLSKWSGSIVTAYDPNGLHPTVIIARQEPDVAGFLWACNNAARTLFGQHDWSDNMALRFFSATPPYHNLVKYYSAQELCAMPPGLYPIPERVRKEYEWDETSFSIHLSAMGLEDRIRIASAFVKERGLL